MSLVVEDGTGKTDAEAYISVDDADTYFTAYGNPSDWSGASTATKETALRMGAQYLDLVYGDRWVGVKGDEDQALDWPRVVSDADYDGYLIDDDEIPTELKRANCEAALRHITEDDGLIPDIDEPGDIQREAVAVGPVKEDKTYIGGKSQVKKFRKIELMVTRLIKDTSTLERA